MFIWARVCGVGLLYAGILFTQDAHAAATSGSLDETFQPELEWTSDWVVSVGLQRDGKILVARSGEDSGVWRLLPDGSLDRTFANPAVIEGDYIRCVEQQDGKILVQGFLRPPGTEYDVFKMIRLNADGSIDSNFHPSATTNRNVTQVIPVSDRLIVSGFQSVDAGTIGFVLLLNLDGTQDASFNEFQTTNGSVAMALTGDRIYVMSRGPMLTVLDHQGTVLTNINTGVTGTYVETWTGGFSGDAMFVQNDGKILLKGCFYFDNNYQNSYGVVRLNADGTFDSSFAPISTRDCGVGLMRLLPNNDFYLCGEVDQNGGTNFTYLARFRSDGTKDSSFQPPPLDGGLLSLAVQTNGQILLAGVGTSIGGVPFRNVARLNNSAPPPLPTIQFTQQHYEISETTTFAGISLIRTGHLSGATVFSYASSDGSATAGLDYESVARTARFQGSEAATVIEIPLRDTDSVDGQRTFTLSLTNVVGGLLGSNATATVTIIDDEVENRVQFSTASFPVKETQSNAVVAVVRDFGSPGAVSVAYRTRDGTALAGRDYISVTGAVAFAEGEYINWFRVPILSTPPGDGNRSVQVELFDPQNGAVISGQTNATLAILDSGPPVIIADASEAFVRAAVAGGGTIRFAGDATVELSSDLPIEHHTSIEANGHHVVFSGGGITRHLTIGSNAYVTLSGVTFIGGRSTNGGSIYNAGTLELRDCIFSNNVAGGTGGMNGTRGTNGVPTSDNWEGTPAGNGGNGTSGEPASGGAIFSMGKLTAFNCSFLANAALGGDGGAGGAGGDTLGFGPPGSGGDGGHAGAASGGAILLEGDGSFEGCRFIANEARAGVGGVFGSPGTNTQFYFTQERVAGTSGLSAKASGGAVSSAGALAILRCHFESNSAIASAGGDGASQGYWYSPSSSFGTPGMHGGTGRDGSDASGGALYGRGVTMASSNVWMGNSTLAGSGGHGGAGGAAQYGSNSRSLGGNGGNAGHGGATSGGAISGNGSLALHSDLFVSNRALAGPGGSGGSGGSSDGGAYGLNPDTGTAGDGGHAEGGAIAHRGAFIATRIRATGNAAKAASGGRSANPGTGHTGIYVSAGTPGNPGAVGDASGGAVFVEGDSVVTDCEFTFNSAEGGAGIEGWSSPYYRLRFDGPDGGHGVSGGSAFGGGAHFAGTTVLQRTTIASNFAVGGAGGAGGIGVNSMYEATRGGVGAPGGNTVGGGIFLRGSALVTNVTIACNECRPGPGGNGGTGDSHQFSPPASIDPTRPGGHAGTVIGVGIAVGAQSSATIAFSTIASNRFLSAPGGIGGGDGTWFQAPDGSNTLVFGTEVAGEGAVTLRNSIVAANPPVEQLGSNVLDGGFNLSSDPAAPFTHSQSLAGINPHIGPLADNGGPAPSMALRSGSPAIDAGDDASCPSNDQRGVSRPFGAHCDIGAFELNEPTFAISGRVQGLNRSTRAAISAGGLNVITDNSGFYTIRNLCAGTYAVTPHCIGAEFSPGMRHVTLSLDALSVNFTAHFAGVNSVTFPQAGVMALQLSGVPKKYYTVENSTNLVEWLGVDVILIGQEGKAEAWYPIDRIEPQRYFRLRRMEVTVPEGP